MKKILVATQKPFAPAAVEGIKQIVENAGFEFELFEKYAEQADFVKAVENANALIIRSDKVTKEVIEAAKNLEIVVRAGAGYDNVDLEAATAKGVVVMNTPGQNSNAVAELAAGTRYKCRFIKSRLTTGCFSRVLIEEKYCSLGILFLKSFKNSGKVSSPGPIKIESVCCFASSGKDVTCSPPRTT